MDQFVGLSGDLRSLEPHPSGLVPFTGTLPERSQFVDVDEVEYGDETCDETA
ncbi:hypothetical protein [Nonomuraea polychroma]|uniref:hypothetical protein n=1 Tax=Nonomuraea polychroma TaxID=46176 RepID=UPI0013E29EE8|nr:hypothetical protein [Nonomuraea polychroma]